MGSSFKALLPLVVLVSVVLSASAVLIEVPGYATRLEGTTEVSATTERPFYAFRGVHYAEQPTNLTRFLVCSNSFKSNQYYLTIYLKYSHQLRKLLILRMRSWMQPGIMLDALKVAAAALSARKIASLSTFIRLM